MLPYTVKLDVRPGLYARLTKEQGRKLLEHGTMKTAIERALALLESDMQADLRVFKARTFLRDALPK